jgi:hypothetical protein
MTIKTVFVGDRPSPKNTNPALAFHGTKSMDTLAGWLFWLGLRKNEVILINSHEPHLMDAILSHHYFGYKIIALGNNASSRLDAMEIPHFKLPHPSGRNRKLNDTKFVDSELEKCKNYLKE